jgi:hypothetical protein
MRRPDFISSEKRLKFRFLYVVYLHNLLLSKVKMTLKKKLKKTLSYLAATLSPFKLINKSGKN